MRTNRRTFIKQFGVLTGTSVLNGCMISRLNKTLVYFIGDSLTTGIGTTGTTETHPNAGNLTYPKQTVKKLNDVDYGVFGYSGQTASQFNAEHKKTF